MPINTTFVILQRSPAIHFIIQNSTFRIQHSKFTANQSPQSCHSDVWMNLIIQIQHTVIPFISSEAPFLQENYVVKIFLNLSICVPINTKFVTLQVSLAIHFTIQNSKFTTNQPPQSCHSDVWKNLIIQIQHTVIPFISSEAPFFTRKLCG